MLGHGDIGMERCRASAELPGHQPVACPLLALARMGCRYLRNAQPALNNQGYLGKWLGVADTLPANWIARRQTACDVPEHIVESAKEYRRAAGRSY